MPEKKLFFTIGAKDDASKVFDQLSRKAKTEMGKVDESFDESRTNASRFADALSSLADEVDANLTQTKSAVDAVAAALGPELTAKTGPAIDRLVADMQRAGISCQEIEADAEQVAAAIKKWDDVGTAHFSSGIDDVGTSADRAKGSIDEVGRSAGSSKSALANMVGNATQDLGDLGGIAGSAGVAIGQMGEYMADAAFDGEGLSSVVRSFAGIAGPIAGIALATKAVADVFARFNAEADRTTDSVNRFNDAMADGSFSAEDYVESLKEAEGVTLDLTRSQSDLENVVAELTTGWKGAITGVGGFAKAAGITGDETEELTTSLTRAGITAEQWAEIVTGGEDALAQLETALGRTNINLYAQGDIVEAARQGQEDYATAVENGAVINEFFGTTAKSASDIIEDSIDVELRRVRAVDSARRADEKAAAALDAEAKAADDAAAAADRHAQAMQDAHDRLTGMADAHRTAADAIREADQAQGLFDLTVAAWSQTVADAGTNQLALQAAIDDGTDAAIALADATVTAYTEQSKANGVTLAAADQTSIWNNEMVDAAATAKGPLKQSIIDYIASVNGIPPEKVSEILALIDQGKLDEAKGALNEASAKRNAEIAAQATGVQSAEAALNYLARERTARVVVQTDTRGIGMIATGSPSVPEPGAIAGEAGPEIAEFPGSSQPVLLTTASFVPPRTKVTSTARTRQILARRHPVPSGAGAVLAAGGGGGGHTYVTNNNYWPAAVSPAAVQRAQRVYERRNGPT